jgi:type VI secretion system protein ImpJ
VDSLKSIFWNQGLFLKPQHFQHLNQQAQSYSQAMSQAKTGISYGISQLKIDENALKTGLLVIEKMECVLPDGTLLVFPGNCSLAPLTLNPEQLSQEGSTRIYVGVAPLLIDQNNLNDEQDSFGRYRLNSDQPVADLFDPQEVAQIRTLNIDVQVLDDHQMKQRPNMLNIQVAKVDYNGSEYELNSKFIADAVTLKAAPVIQHYVKAIKQSLLSRYEQLESFTALDSKSSVDFSSVQLSTMLSMAVISRYIPSMAHFEEVLTARPSDVYLTMRQLIAELSPFSKSISVLGESADNNKSLIPFNQRNLSECFARANELIKGLLDNLTVDPELLLELQHQGQAKYVTALTPEFTDSHNKLYLRLRTHVDLEEIMEDLLHFAKLGADGQVDIYIKRALPGISLNYLSRKPLGVASTPNSFYFSFDCRSFEWQKVVELGRIAMIWTDAPEDLSVEVIAVKG